MPLSLTAFTANTSITAASLLSRVEALEDYINGGIAPGDFQTSTPWLEHFQIVGPRFFGAPARRAEMTSCQIAWEHRGSTALEGALFTDDICYGKALPVPGLCRTVNVQPPRGETSIQVIVKACWYTYEDGGNATKVLGTGVHAYETHQAAGFDLWVDGASDFDCSRDTFSNLSLETHMQAKTHSLASTFTLSRGVHNVGIRCFMENSGAGATRYHNFVWVRARAFVIRAMYR